MEDECKQITKIEDVRHFIYKTVFSNDLEAQTTDGWEFVQVVPDEEFALGTTGYNPNGEVSSTPVCSYQQSKYLLRKCSMLPDVAGLRQLLKDHQSTIEKADKEATRVAEKYENRLKACEVREDEKTGLVDRYREKFEDQLATTQLQAETLKMIKQKLGSVAFDDLVIG